MNTGDTVHDAAEFRRIGRKLLIEIYPFVPEDEL